MKIEAFLDRLLALTNNSMLLMFVITTLLLAVRAGSAPNPEDAFQAQQATALSALVTLFMFIKKRIKMRMSESRTGLEKDEQRSGYSRLQCFSVFLIPKERRDDAIGDLEETFAEVVEQLGLRAAKAIWWKEWFEIMCFSYATRVRNLLVFVIGGQSVLEMIRRLGK